MVNGKQGGWLAQMNAVLGLVNLLPYGGSDGQRILAEIRNMVVRLSSATAVPDPARTPPKSVS